LAIVVIPWYRQPVTVSLTRELEELVNRKIKTGLYHTASEVIREGLRLLEERDRLYHFRLEELRRDVKQGLDQLDRGEGRPLDVGALKARLRKEAGRKARRRAK
jgi:antitoxin ParD1/3/4